MLTITTKVRAELNKVLDTMIKKGLNTEKFEHDKLGTLILVKDGTEDSQKKIEEEGSILDILEYNDIKFLICRK